ncbi:hypothetical protein GCM10020295_03590 [Streptomyces cinereospinus]
MAGGKDFASPVRLTARPTALARTTRASACLSTARESMARSVTQWAVAPTVPAEDGGHRGDDAARVGALDDQRRLLAGLPVPIR